MKKRTSLLNVMNCKLKCSGIVTERTVVTSSDHLRTQFVDLFAKTPASPDNFITSTKLL